jgi:endonuclease/exonuclease/phosphatase family metal-dependent hydrolase
MTYNIHRAIGMDRRFRPERILAVLEHYQPDVVLLQEVDEGVPRSREIDLAKQLASFLDYPHYAVGHNVSLRKGRYGNATLSRYPILRESNIDLTVARRKRRGCQHTSIRVENGTDAGHDVAVFNLHLGLSARERARQVGTLVRCKEFSGLPAGQACLVAGDFNDWRSLLHPIFTEILSFDCATQHPLRYDGALRTYPSFSPTGGLDKIYFRGPLRMVGARSCRLGVCRLASDHLPVLADFELG